MFNRRLNLYIIQERFNDVVTPIKEVTFLGSDAIFLERWKNVENISARLIEFYEDVVILECLIDRELGIYQEREFSASLFLEYELRIGDLFYLRVFERPSEMKLEIHNDPNLTFEKDFPKLDFKQLFNKSKLFKKDN